MVQISEFLLTVAAKASQNSQYVRNKEHREAAKQNARGFAGNILEVRLLGCGILMVSSVMIPVCWCGHANEPARI